MSRHYYTWEENEAYKEGRKDEERHRRSFDHDKYSDNPDDLAYFQGRRDEETRQRIEEEERMMREEQERLEQEREYERKRQEELEYQEYLASQEEPLDEPPPEYFISKSSEEELWNQILNDERDEYENR